MPKFINSVVSRVNFLTKKGLTGYFAPEKICAELHAESMNVWRQYIEKFEKSGTMDTYTRPFQDSEEVTLIDGVGTIVSLDYLYLLEGYVNATTRTEIHKVDNTKWNARITDPVKVPTATYPVGSNNGQELKVVPIDAFPKVIVSFLKQPTLPVWAYTVVSDRYVYDDSASVDWEWHKTIADLIIDKALANLGISIRNLEMQQFSKEQQVIDNR